MSRSVIVAAALVGLAVAASPLSAHTPQAAQAAAPAAQQGPPKTFDIAFQLSNQFSSARRLLTAAADRMPAESYGFKPTPDMRTFAASVAHVAQANFGYCANLTGKPNPHKGENLEETATTKDAVTALLKESFDFCATYATGLTTERANESYQANSQGGPIDVARGGLLATMIEHSNEMYGYMAVYLRLKGLTPPSSDGRAARGRGVGPGAAGGIR